MSTLAQSMMQLTYQRIDASALSNVSSVLATAKAQLAMIERLAAADQRVRASLDGARTALLTAARELREHLIRHGCVADDITSAPQVPLQPKASGHDRGEKSLKQT